MVYHQRSKELGSVAPKSVQELAACGSQGTHKGNIWRDLRSRARTDNRTTLASFDLIVEVLMHVHNKGTMPTHRMYR